jgi:hypothetical protein
MTRMWAPKGWTLKRSSDSGQQRSDAEGSEALLPAPVTESQIAPETATVPEIGQGATRSEPEQSPESDFWIFAHFTVSSDEVTGRVMRLLTHFAKIAAGLIVVVACCTAVVACCAAIGLKATAGLNIHTHVPTGLLAPAGVVGLGTLAGLAALVRRIWKRIRKNGSGSKHDQGSDAGP